MNYHIFNQLSQNVKTKVTPGILPLNNSITHPVHNSVRKIFIKLSMLEMYVNIKWEPLKKKLRPSQDRILWSELSLHFSALQLTPGTSPAKCMQLFISIALATRAKPPFIDLVHLSEYSCLALAPLVPLFSPAVIHQSVNQQSCKLKHMLWRLATRPWWPQMVAWRFIRNVWDDTEDTYTSILKVQ